MADVWTLVAVTLSGTTLLSEPPQNAASISISVLPGFESKEACENSHIATYSKDIEKHGGKQITLYTCEPGALSLDPSILAVPDANGRTIYAKERWDE